MSSQMKRSGMCPLLLKLPSGKANCSLASVLMSNRNPKWQVAVYICCFLKAVLEKLACFHFWKLALTTKCLKRNRKLTKKEIRVLKRRNRETSLNKHLLTKLMQKRSKMEILFTSLCALHLLCSFVGLLWDHQLAMVLSAGHVSQKKNTRRVLQLTNVHLGFQEMKTWQKLLRMQR